ncbi:Non-specific serine/threonine protein kinase [Bertholletia excelsa]
MDFGYFTSFLVLSLFFSPSLCQQPNSDEYFVSDFFQKMSLGPTSSQRFNFSASVCTWKGVFCEKENVIKLVASGLGLSGLIPETTIGKLEKLEFLDLSMNNITGLSSDFWSLGSLNTLNLSSNLISGTLPGNIGNFALLETIDLSNNKFSGEIPEDISSSVNLQVLKLGGNQFDSKIPYGIMNCQSLVLLDLSSNHLNGALPDGFVAAFPKLEFLNLARNRISGRASDFSGISAKYLNISRNLFRGSVIGIVEEPLEVIDMSQNQFDGHISQVHFSSSFNRSRLVYLDLSENHISGGFFSNLNDAQSLKHLNLAHNRFWKQAFPEIGLLSGLEYLNLSETNLVGHIPNEISELISLRTLDLSKNHLRNRIPHLGTENLQVLDVSLNNLSGEIPFSLLEKLQRMERFNFSFNNLSLCASALSPKTLDTAFIGSQNSCPIAAKPDLFRRKAPGHHRGFELALALALSMVCLLVGLLFLAFGCRRKTRMWAVKQDPCKEEPNISGPFSFQTDSTTWVADIKLATSVPVVIFEKPLLNFTFADLLSATSNFDRGTLLADGRFGPVYRGFLPSGIHVAVKVLVHGWTMTDQEAARELEHLGRIKHPNLVPLMGYCLAGDQRIAIYEYMENGNLQNLLHDLPLGVPKTEDWSTDTWEEENDYNGIQNIGSEGLLTTWRYRHRIALGTARALAFLHHGCSPPIIHRDVKANSVYLDSNLEPRLSDFGLAKIFGHGPEDEIAHGIAGYAPPEFLHPETSTPTAVTPKADVYAFGVVLFELITGKKPAEDEHLVDKGTNLVNWVRGLVKKNQGSRAIDPKIRGTGVEAQMEEALKIGYLCTADLPLKRPSMQQVVGLLKDIEPTTHQ